MSAERIRELLAELRNEIQESAVDADTLTALRALDADIHALLEISPTEPDAEALLNQARQLEAKFAVEHPAAEQFMREVIETLVKIGV